MLILLQEQHHQLNPLLVQRPIEPFPLAEHMTKRDQNISAQTLLL